MSNRAYLYSTNLEPGADSDARRVVGICEWSYDLPIAFKLLLSGNPRKCRSLIWDDPEAVALIGDYDAGVAALTRFLARVPHPAVPGLAEEAREFLDAEGNRSRYFFLEPLEIFWLGDAEPAAAADHLAAELADLGPHMERAIAEIKARMHEETHPPGFLARLLGARTPVRRENSNDLVYALGLGGWSNTLFYDLTG